MSHKNQTPIIFNWQSADPRATLLPLNPKTQGSGSIPSGIVGGTMATTATIYSQILDISRFDNIFIDVIWSGTPVGTLAVELSASGIVFTTIPAASFNPTLVSPAGSAAKLGLNIPLMGAKYLLLVYTNSSSTGTLNAYGQLKDI